MKKVNDIDVLELKQQVDLVWLPSPSQRACKAKFWKRMDYDYQFTDNITLAMAVQLTNNGELNRWWNQEGFKEWFLNKDEASERIEYLYMLWMDKAEELLLNPDANHNAIVQIGKIIANLSGRGETEVKFADESIQKMSKAQLQAFIEKVAPRLIKSSQEPKLDDSGSEPEKQG